MSELDGCGVGERFFSDQVTKRALVDLASCSHLVLYCGAGVTMNQTGMDWSKMLANAFGTDEDQGRLAGLLQSLHDWDLDFPAIASALVGSDGEEVCETVDRKQQLRRALYRPDRGVWGGDLVVSVAWLALFARLGGRSVTIITTNFDDYIETQIQVFATQLRNGIKDFPVISVKVSDQFPRDLTSATSDRAGIHLFHIHGTVPRDSQADSDSPLVLTETDYARVREDVTTFLTASFSTPDVGLLILGASITDSPLIASLAASRESRGARYALWARPDRMYLDPLCSDLLRMFRARSAHLGLQLLAPDFLFQIPTFCFELAILLPKEDPQAFLSSPDRYGARLVYWWKEFSSDNPEGGTERIHLQLRKTLQQVKLILSSEGSESPEDEELRLDLWVRSNPADDRVLTLWASSSALLVEHSAHKSERLRLGSGHATVIGFSRGRPVTLDLAELAPDDRQDTPPPEARWKSFLVVPLEVQVRGLGTPVAVATLCSTLRKDRCAFGNISSAEQAQIVRLLQAVLWPIDPAMVGNGEHQ